jgi:hypothetical protein
VTADGPQASLCGKKKPVQQLKTVTGTGSGGPAVPDPPALKVLRGYFTVGVLERHWLPDFSALLSSNFTGLSR